MEKSSNDSFTEYEKDLVDKICHGDEKAFEKLFFEYYYPLCSFAVKITKSGELARDAVQEVFYKLWRNREGWEIHYSLKIYLYRAVRNQALNLVGIQKNNRQLVESLKEESYSFDHGYFGRDTKKYSEKLIKNIWELVTQMPERRRQVFVLHRRHGLSYKEISAVMAISDKTVENHMGHALQFIRDNIDPDHFM